RLALAVADAVLPDYADGEWFVELAAVSEPAPRRAHRCRPLRGAPVPERRDPTTSRSASPTHDAPGAGQLRAPAPGVCRAGPGAVAHLPRHADPDDQPRAARSDRRSRVARAGTHYFGSSEVAAL